MVARWRKLGWRKYEGVGYTVTLAAGAHGLVRRRNLLFGECVSKVDSGERAQGNDP